MPVRGEAAEIALVLAECDQVARRPGDDARGRLLAEDLSQPHDIRAYGGGGAGRWGSVPDIARDTVHRDHMVDIEQQRRQDDALPGGRYVHLPRVQPDRKRAEQQEFQRTPHSSCSSRRSRDGAGRLVVRGPVGQRRRARPPASWERSEPVNDMPRCLGIFLEPLPGGHVMFDISVACFVRLVALCSSRAVTCDVGF